MNTQTSQRSIRRLFIANRGEIALRIQRSCRELGIETVQACSGIDLDSLAAQSADKAVLIGGPAPSDSYLRGDAIIAAALETDCDAVHPGYGFLSESGDFADSCLAAGLIFVGPSGEVIRQMGDKAQARAIAKAAGLPIVPGSDGLVSDIAQAQTVAARLGYPLLIKASSGGGGRGMRLVYNADTLQSSIEAAAREAGSAFGSPAVYMERYLEKIRHIEVQVLGDGENLIHLGTRDCSTQRRHQKLLEEAPAPYLTPAQTDKMTADACALAKRCGYSGAGTVEFVLDMASGDFYFIEMNTRIQVEHPVTESITGIDIVAQQIRIAEGRPLEYGQEDVTFTGHAIECRINAEDSAKGFMPKPGTVTALSFPDNAAIRVDGHIRNKDTLSAHYDSLLAKIICHAPSRKEAISLMRDALDRTIVEGVPTTLPFHREILAGSDFDEGRVHTRYVKDTLYQGRPLANLL